MKLKTMLLSLLLVSLFSIEVSAHTKLEQSTPVNGEVVTKPLENITLTFGTKIESTSRFEVVSTDGTQVNVTKITVNENGLKGNISEPLKNGEYKVIWNIIGADGHPINGEFTFTVNIAEANQQTTDTSDETVEESVEEEKPQANVPAPLNEKTEVKDSPDFLLPVVVVIMSLIGIGFLWWILRRK